MVDVLDFSVSKLTLTWSQLAYEVPDGNGTTATVLLHPQDGHIVGGTMTAILGPSGI